MTDLHPFPTADGSEAETGLLLDCEKLTKTFGALSESPVIALNGVSVRVHEGQTVGIVGESGCGKSTLLRTVIRLEQPNAGNIRFKDIDVLNGSKADLTRFRRSVQWVPQNPYSSLDPRMQIATIVGEQGLTVSRKVCRPDAVVQALADVGLGAKYLTRYPHELSGGERQRVSLARAMILEPELLLLDEPVSALDVSVRAEVLNILDDLRASHNLSYVMVAHDLAVVSTVCSYVVVMYRGTIAEKGSRDAVFGQPLHPYTVALLSAIPTPDPRIERRRERIVLRGEASQVTASTIGCVFRDRCPTYALRLEPNQRALCDAQAPLLAVSGDADQSVACHFPGRAAPSSTRR